VHEYRGALAGGGCAVGSACLQTDRGATLSEVPYARWYRLTTCMRSCSGTFRCPRREILCSRPS
jgi:hypothetical protein